MGSRTVFDCDWCGVIEEDERTVQSVWVDRDGQLICSECGVARAIALTECKEHQKQLRLEREATDQIQIAVQGPAQKLRESLSRVAEVAFGAPLPEPAKEIREDLTAIGCDLHPSEPPASHDGDEG